MREESICSNLGGELDVENTELDVSATRSLGSIPAWAGRIAAPSGR